MSDETIDEPSALDGLVPVEAVHTEVDHTEVDHTEVDHTEVDHTEVDHTEVDHTEVDHTEVDHTEVDHTEVDHTEVESRAQAARRLAWAPRTRIAVVSLALVAMMFLFVFPTRSYLAQKRQVGQAAHAVDVLEAQNAVLSRQASRLTTRSEIERLAREQFNMVMPGEQAYDVVEAPGSNGDPTTTTSP